MILISVGNEQVAADEFTGGWLLEQLNRRERDGGNLCARVSIGEGDVDMAVSTPECGRSGGGGRAARPTERRIFDLWDQLGLNEAGWEPGKLIAFVKRVKNLV